MDEIKLKQKYDEILKNDYIGNNKLKSNQFGYVIYNNYNNYFSNQMLEYFKTELGKHFKEYDSGSGQELTQKNGQPPKFLSIGSSSNFCFFSLRNDGFKYFLSELEGENYEIINSNNKEIEFEKKLKIIPRGIANLDAYVKTKKCEYFFECKCHELFDNHKTQLSKSYFNGELFVSKKEFNTWFNSSGKINFENIGINSNSGFDFKQFCTHLMGISKNKNLTAHLIYYYCLPKMDSIKIDKKLYKKITQFLVDTKTILTNKKLISYCEQNNIYLHFFIKFDGYTQEMASKQNTLEGSKYLAKLQD